MKMKVIPKSALTPEVYHGNSLTVSLASSMFDNEFCLTIVKIFMLVTLVLQARRFVVPLLVYDFYLLSELPSDKLKYVYL